MRQLGTEGEGRLNGSGRVGRFWRGASGGRREAGAGVVRGTAASLWCLRATKQASWPLGGRDDDGDVRGYVPITLAAPHV